MRTSLHLQSTGLLAGEISLELSHIEPGQEGQLPLEGRTAHASCISQESRDLKSALRQKTLLNLLLKNRLGRHLGGDPNHL